MPPIQIPIEAKEAKPHNAYVDITADFSLKTEHLYAVYYAYSRNSAYIPYNWRSGWNT